MKKMFCQAMLLAVFSAAVVGCKKDAPILPSKTTPIDGSTGGETGPGANEPVNSIGLPIGPVNTIRVQVGGTTGIQTYPDVTFTTILGANNMIGKLYSDNIGVGYVGAKTGTFDMPILNVGDFVMPKGKVGKIEVTVSTMDASSKGTIKGGFEAELVNSSGLMLLARGSFNIKQ